MNQEVSALEPQPLWQYFEQLNEIPRGSKKEEKAVAFIRDFGRSIGLETYVDEVGNVIIKKPASPGMENVQGVILQAHLDMVHQKNADVDFDFDTQGIRSLIDGEWVTANGTTLGADNGIGVAMIMTVLSDKSMVHGPVEALFTIDEETGMTGAFALKGGLLDGRLLINLDNEDEGELCIGCAGGVNNTVTMPYKTENIEGLNHFKVSITGLKGGHSGADIHLGRGNANKILTRVLIALEDAISLKVAKIVGGSLRNAIPREAFAWIAIPGNERAQLNEKLSALESEIRSELHTTDPGISITSEPSEASGSCAQNRWLRRFLRALDAAPNGLYAMSQDFEGLVETSTNLAMIQMEDGNANVQFLTRSSVESRKADLTRIIESSFAAFDNASVVNDGSYPGWMPNPKSTVLQITRDAYKKLFDKEAKVLAIHAGLECGILSTNYKGMDMVSLGPTIKNPHSPDEKAHIPSISKCWDYLCFILRNIPEKN